MPGFSEYDKHFSDFNTPVKKRRGLGDLIFDGVDKTIDSISYSKENRLANRMRKETIEFNLICQYAKHTGHKIYVYTSDKYDIYPLGGTLITDYKTWLLVDYELLKNWMLDGTLVINKAAVTESVGYLDVLKNLKPNTQANLVTPYVCFPEAKCSNLKNIYKVAKKLKK